MIEAEAKGELRSIVHDSTRHEIRYVSAADEKLTSNARWTLLSDPSLVVAMILENVSVLGCTPAVTYNMRENMTVRGWNHGSNPL